MGLIIRDQKPHVLARLNNLPEADRIAIIRDTAKTITAPILHNEMQDLGNSICRRADELERLDRH